MLPYSAVKHLNQVLVSNELLCFWLQLAVVALKAGVAWLMEHPADPQHCAGAPSVWKLPEVRRIADQPGVRMHLLLQGHYGALCAKPTNLMSFALPALPEALTRWRRTHIDYAKWISLKGKSQDGTWNTAKAKAYPPSLNACLVETFYQRAIVLQAHLSAESAETLDYKPFFPVVDEITNAKL
eukprot:Skav214978  [mRNA]  locus=scaffold508:15908:16456:- [translate_table: standard]